MKGQIVKGGIIAKTSYKSLVTCPESNKKGTVTRTRKDELGMAGLKKYTRFVGLIITSIIHPYACILDYCH